MATVDLILPAFGIKWAQDGTVEAIDEAQWRAGWSFIGATPPSVEQFNKVHQVQDEKSNWLYGQLKTITDAAGITLTEGVLTSLQTAIRANSTPHLAVVTATGNWTVPAGVYSVDVEAWGGGGCGGGVGSTGNGSSAGGGSGGYGRGTYAVTPGQVIPCTIGVGGISTPPTNGGATSFGAYLSTNGGQFGPGNSVGNVGVGGTAGTGGLINLPGGDGAAGLASGSGPGGVGGAAPLGGSGGASAAGTPASGGVPGGGGGGRGSTTTGAGGAGARGQINITY